jgi:hypothetical protein
MSKMNIQCKTYEQFMIVINQLVERGLGFEADADSLLITLTGSY